MEARGPNSSQRDMLVPKSHCAACICRCCFPKELGVLAMLQRWDSSHALATRLTVEVSGSQALLNICSTTGTRWPLLSPVPGSCGAP